MILTRADDNALGDGKMQDLNNRRNLANNNNADIFVSIHQNSFQAENAKGGQVFYYGDSEKSQFLAESVQNEFISFLDPNNNRVAKANKDYYVLRSTSVPAIIIECGFLSNEKERKNLLDDEYQEKIAWSIYVGLINYFEKDNSEFS